jgi:hypothetical protein
LIFERHQHSSSDYFHYEDEYIETTYHEEE